jgi:hypothetical protein
MDSNQMPENHYAACCWLARPESAEACARRTERFFQFLERCDPAWTRWYETAASFEEARKHQIFPEAGTFQQLFSEKENRIVDGYKFWLWTGDSAQETSSVNATCGSSSVRLPSNCVVQPYGEGPVGERVLTAPVMTEVLRAMALAWEPEWGIVTSDAHRQLAVKGFPHPGTFVGWVTYFAHFRGTAPPLPAPVRIEPVEDRGTLVILTPERFTASNPEHVALAARVQELLSRAGLLRPLQTWPIG